jgi:outer membrane protein
MKRRCESSEPPSAARARSAMPKRRDVVKRARMVALAIAAAALTALPAYAETYKIGVMNVEQILRQSKAAQAAQARIEQEFKARDADLSRREQEVQAAAAALANDRPTLSAEEATRRDRDVEARTREVQRLRQQFAEDLRARQFDELDKLKARLDQVLTKYAKDNHFDLILQDAAFVGPAVNITDDVIKALESAPAK